MKAVRFVGVQKPLQMQEVPVPKISGSDVLVEVKAAGICHSDAHYRAGLSPVSSTPLTLGHEVAGLIKEVGSEVPDITVGERVALHYNVTCGHCFRCASGNDQFCEQAKMIGHHIDGGYAEYIAVPARNAIRLPDKIPFEQGATLMCASATAYHALLKARIKTGDKVAILGAGGLGQSAIQLARTFGALQVFAVDLNEDKLEIAASHGAVSINANEVDPVEEIKRQTGGKGVDVAVEMIGLLQTTRQAIECVGPLGRVVLVGLFDKPVELITYKDLLANEVELIGSNDHRLHELTTLVDFVKNGKLDTSKAVTKTIPL